MKTGGKPAPVTDWPDDLSRPVRSLPEHRALRVALSGGLDSLLLLHVAAACHADVVAVHVNHQLQPDHEETEQFCRDVCAELSVPIIVERISVPVGTGQAGGLEDAARNARYRVFDHLQQPGDLLLMAHHADDQLETVLFRLLRGSGVGGLAGMPRTRSLGKGRLLRPWLAVGRERLEQVAAGAGLDWREDPSNQSQVHDRNYLRHAVVPGLKQRWPGLLRRVAHSARACADSEYLNRKLAELHWQACADGGHRVTLAGFRALDRIEQRNLLCWRFRQNGWPLPSLADWDQVLTELLEAAEGGQPELRGPGYSVRRYREHLYFVPDAMTPAGDVFLEPDKPLRWGSWRITLAACGAADTADAPVSPIRVSTRRGGERVRLHPGRPSRLLKTWLQEQGVPPWERAALPLVFRQGEEGDELIAIGNLWTSDQYSGGAPAAGWRLIVERDCD
ncbi:tRNA(Ile)-lysidine synthase [Marinobacter persicus]|uniref:tRNA(Ile)-lysidine synthase n=1 Tax=Marinobacter persicus TaxID=930118 RepID=A0A1I3Y445_9GAMM|nr:tRNA lysidine(34) synthetase TilS [Marinobacter persicus]GHD53237.1 tRNA(Ile)-lysidine synthase [Marinobacter persicus]SFK26523.1 tRNA(Ile)-lysidine synthase [Marinobacter persicus]